MLRLSRKSLIRIEENWGPQGFWGSGEKGYLFLGSWGALVIIFRDLESKLILLGILGAVQKVKNKFTKSHL